MQADKLSKILSKAAKNRKTNPINEGIRREKIRKAVKERWDNFSPEERKERTRLQQANRLVSMETKKQMSIKIKALWANGHYDGTSSLYIKTSQFEKDFAKLLEDNKIIYKKQIRLEGFRFIYDFFLPKENLIIETSGDYWHANPIRFKANDIVYRDVKAKDIWKRDLEKQNAANSLGYKFLTIWESEFKQNNNIKVLLHKVI